MDCPIFGLRRQHMLAALTEMNQIESGVELSVLDEG